MRRLILGVTSGFATEFELQDVSMVCGKTQPPILGLS